VRTALAAVGVVALLAFAPGVAHADDPVPAPTASEEASGCAENPVICQSGGAPQTTTDCGQVEPGSAGEPATDTPTATIAPDEQTPGLDPGVICIASGVAPPGTATDGGAAAPEAAPAQLPRTGPAPLLESLALGSWLLLLGVLALVAGRRTARA
jgi:hypothetical protein